MLAFAANSLLCRMALMGGAIDAASFMLIRAVTGAIVLALLMRLFRSTSRIVYDWPSALMLVCYMASFSFGYLELPTGAGALILFVAVQLTMLSSAWHQGERFNIPAWIGIMMALCGLSCMLLPGNGAPNQTGVLLMSLAGVSWGMYSLLGKNGGDPIASTAGNFLLASPVVLVLWLPALFTGSTGITTSGVILAGLSGAVASALGYAVWFAALQGLDASRAAVVQLSVPVIAGAGGVLLLSEALTIRLLLSSAVTLGGIYLVIRSRLPQRKCPPSVIAKPTWRCEH